MPRNDPYEYPGKPPRVYAGGPIGRNTPSTGGRNIGTPVLPDSPSIDPLNPGALNPGGPRSPIVPPMGGQGPGDGTGFASMATQGTPQAPPTTGGLPGATDPILPGLPGVGGNAPVLPPGSSQGGGMARMTTDPGAGLPAGQPGAPVTPPMIPRGGQPPGTFESVTTDPMDPNAPPELPTGLPPDPTTPGSPMPPAETPQQEYDRFFKDYWAPDRIPVLARMKAALAGSGAPAGGGGDFGADWQKGGGRTPGDLKTAADAWNAAHPDDKVEVFGSKGDKVRYHGRVYDAVIAAGAGGQGASWYDITDGGGGGGAAPATSAFQDQIRAMLLDQLKKAGQPIDLNDPALAAELGTQNNALEQTRRDRRAAAAERAAMQGLLSGGQSSGSFDAEVASGFEDKANNQSSVIANLYGREMTAKRSQMQTLLNMALQSGDAESARALQLQLANMDAELRRMGLAQDDRHWADSFGLSAAQFQYLKDRDLAGYGAGR